jgi:hypothetical protein
MTFGGRITTINPAQSLQSLTSAFERNKANADKLFMQDFTNRGTVSADMGDNYRQANAPGGSTTACVRTILATKAG